MDIAAILDDIGAAMAQATDRGQVACYIPELARVDPEHQQGLYPCAGA
jgi:glutaminase|tara:strand:- start:499 stop:642 length:144 start_codon:yes stop_codon:yes gene_type:complete